MKYGYLPVPRRSKYRMAESKQRGVFICLEGIDGSGKTTQAHRLVKTLTRMGYEAVYTTEPSGGIYGRTIRKHILHGDKRVPAVVEAVLFAVDRIDHVQNEIQPLLDRGKIVVSDRYVYSSIAYQGAAHLDMPWIKAINSNAITPDFVVYIDVSPEAVTSRIQRRKSVMETLQTQNRVRKLYLKLVEKEQLAMVYGSASMKEVAQAILNMVLEFLKSAGLSADYPA